VPLVVMLAGAAVALVRTRGARPRLNPARWAWLALLGFTLAAPLALNFYTPEWNAFLKQVPLIKSSSNLLRWFLVYIPVTILAAALLFDWISPLAKRRNAMLVAAAAALVLLNAAKDRDFYHAQHYRPDTIVNAWRAANAGTAEPRIRYIGAFVDANQRIRMSPSGNDLIAAGASQLACYNPIFGYRLERFPVKALHPGPVLAETDGVLNIKNPACYLYPEENSCAPGDHFSAAQREAAQAFAGYKPYPFVASAGQRAANRVTQVTLALLAALFAVMVAKRFKKSDN